MGREERTPDRPPAVQFRLIRRKSGPFPRPGQHSRLEPRFTGGLTVHRSRPSTPTAKAIVRHDHRRGSCDPWGSATARDMESGRLPVRDRPVSMLRVYSQFQADATNPGNLQRIGCGFDAGEKSSPNTGIPVKSSLIKPPLETVRLTPRPIGGSIHATMPPDAADCSRNHET